MSPYQWSCVTIVAIVYLSVENCHCSWIDRRSEGLTVVPTDIPTDVTVLDLSYNQITALLDCEFCQYTQLQRLYISNNLISVINSTAFSNTVLTVLILLSNQLTAVPDLHFIAETLITLSVAYNPISFINQTTFDECTALDTLYMYYCQLTTLSYFSVETLQHIDLSNNPLVCDSRLWWLKVEAESGVTVVDFTCAGPPSLQGRSFSSLTTEELAPVGES